MTDAEKLHAYEEMHRAIKAEYARTTAKLANLKAQGREKTATYRQLFGNKFSLQTVLNYYKTYGLENG